MELFGKNTGYTFGLVAIGALSLLAYQQYQKQKVAPQFLDTIIPAEIQPYVIPATVVGILGLGTLMFLRYRRSQTAAAPSGLSRGFSFRFK